MKHSAKKVCWRFSYAMGDCWLVVSGSVILAQWGSGWFFNGWYRRT
jgi:hypothetical protein